MTEDLFDQVEVDEPEFTDESPIVPGETPAKDDFDQETKETTSTSTSTTTTTTNTTTTTTTTTTSTTTSTSTSTVTDEDTPSSPSEPVSLDSISDESLLAPDNLDVLADEVGEEIGEFEYNTFENESLPKPPTPQELRNAIVNEGMFIEHY